MKDNFSGRTKEILSISRSEAMRLGNDFISNEHFVLAILKTDIEPTIQILRYLKADIDAMRDNLESCVRNKSSKHSNGTNSLPLTAQAEGVLQQSASEAAESGDAIEPDHLLLAILRLADSAANEILTAFNIRYMSYKKIYSKKFSAPILLRLASADLVSFEAIIKKRKEIDAVRTKKKEVEQKQKFDDAAYMDHVEREMMEELDKLIFKWEHDIENIPYEKKYFDNESLVLTTEKFIAKVYNDIGWAERVSNWMTIVNERVKQAWTEEIDKRLNGNQTGKEKTGGISANAPSKYHVFISKKESDYLLCKPLYDFLTGKNLNVFLSEESLQHVGNSDYMEEIDRALDEADHLIIFCSKAEYFNSPYVRAEWKTFVNEKRGGRKKGNIISVISGSINIHEIPIALRSFEVIKIDPNYLQRIHRYVYK